MVRNKDELASRGIHLNSIMADIAGSAVWEEPEVKKIHDQMQRSTLLLIKKLHTPDPQIRLRHKLNRWYRDNAYKHPAAPPTYSLAGSPHVVANKVHRCILRLRKLVPPRVCAAVFKFIFNGWCTEARFQRQRQPSCKCVFGCGASAMDSQRHYCCCPVTHLVWRTKLRTHIDVSASLSRILEVGVGDGAGIIDVHKDVLTIAPHLVPSGIQIRSVLTGVPTERIQAMPMIVIMLQLTLRL